MQAKENKKSLALAARQPKIRICSQQKTILQNCLPICPKQAQSDQLDDWLPVFAS